MTPVLGATIDNSVVRADGINGNLIQGSSVAIDDNGNIQLDSIIDHIIYQETDLNPGITGKNFTIHAQDMTGAETTGGSLTLRAGHGSTHGTFCVYDADGVTQRITIYPGGDIILNAPNQCGLISGGIIGIDVRSIHVRIGVPEIYFLSTMISPTIYQNDDATTGAEGDSLTIHAQDCNGSGSTVGGDLVLRPGHGASHGSLILKDADAVSILTVNSTSVTATKQIVLPSYSKASLPTGITCGLIYVTDAKGGAEPAFYNGTNWCRVSDGTTIN